MTQPNRSQRMVVARQDSQLEARVLRRFPLRYSGGANPRLDRPAHVRAASGLVRAGERLVVVQDDANFLALVDPATGFAKAVTLPAGAGGKRQFDDGRGNKADKLDLETLARVPAGDARGGSLLVALGSGSSPRREWIALVENVESTVPVVHLRHAREFYAGLRALPEFAGGELNVEGLLHLGQVIRLFGRGNGATRGGVASVNATCDVEWAALRASLERPDDATPPTPIRAVHYDLGEIDGIRLGFTDAATGWSTDGTTALYAAAAEDSPDATRDGKVAGSAIGVLAWRGEEVQARWTPLRDDRGGPLALKVEGLVLDGTEPTRLWVVVDFDEAERPSELCEVRLSGPWR